MVADFNVRGEIEKVDGKRFVVNVLYVMLPRKCNLGQLIDSSLQHIC